MHCLITKTNWKVCVTELKMSFTKCLDLTFVVN